MHLTKPHDGYPLPGYEATGKRLQRIRVRPLALSHLLGDAPMCMHCGFQLEQERERGCTKDECSMRPMPPPAWRLLWFAATQRVDANDDPEITCIICGERICDACFTTRGGGCASMIGLHRDCQRWAQRLAEGSNDE